MAEIIRGTVDVRYRGRLGNNLTQYCIGRILAEELGFSLKAPAIPGFPNAQALRSDGSKTIGPARVLGGHRLDLDSILADRTPRRIILHGFFQRYEYLQPHKNAIREGWLVSDARERAAPDDLTIHIRAGDIWRGDQPPGWVHPDYHALPFSYFDAIVRSRCWCKITVVTEDRLDPMVLKLAQRFDAEVRSGSVLEDFNLLRASSNLVLSVSSYAWWAGWLSDASQIFFPLAGCFDPMRARQRPLAWQQNLWVDDEPRYVASVPYGLSGPWTGTEEERERLLNS